MRFGKLLLAVVGLSAATTPILVAQSQAAKPPAFEVASIRLDAGPPRPIQITTGNLRGSATIKDFIRSAYGVDEYQVSGGPGWLEDERYRIEAKAEGVASQDRLKEMLQTLLQDRFKLLEHRETREMPVYFLLVAKGGLKLRELKDGDRVPAPPPRKPGATAVISFTGELQAFADPLSQPRVLGRPVIDKTGLTGRYGSTFNWGRAKISSPSCRKILV